MYTFNSKEVDGQSVVHLINLVLGEDIVGAEVGVLKAQSLCTFLQQCPNISKMYAIDKFVPYTDYLGHQVYSVDEKNIEYIKMVAYHNVKYSGFDHKVKFLEMDSLDAAKLISDNELDFVFLDAYLSKEQADVELEAWYPKVKRGGLFIGHDAVCADVEEAVRNFREKNNIQNRVSVFDNTWAWIK